MTAQILAEQLPVALSLEPDLATVVAGMSLLRLARWAAGQPGRPASAS